MKTLSFCALAIGLGLSLAAFLILGSKVLASGPNWPMSKASALAVPTPAMSPAVANNLADFDDLDFHVYTGAHWENLPKSHAADIVVYYPDGHTTKGIPAHIKELNFM